MKQTHADKTGDAYITTAIRLPPPELRQPAVGETYNRRMSMYTFVFGFAATRLPSNRLVCHDYTGGCDCAAVVSFAVPVPVLAL
jgi:hypothetical protein